MVPHFYDEGLCQYASPELFFPVGEHGPAQGQTEQAKAICGQCPVRTECLSWALETDQGYGIWGGTTPGERRALRQKRRTPV